MATLRLGTRGSALALAQAKLVADALGGAEVVPIQSPVAARQLPDGADKSRFVKELEEALVAEEIDLAVHSAKDLPGELPEGLEIVGVPAREDPTDAFVGTAVSVADLPEGARLGTSSLRRRAQLLATRPDLEISDLHGNVDTRLRRLAEGGFEGLVLATAGLRRLGRSSEISFCFGEDVMTPAAGQGALALEARRGDRAAAEAAEAVTHGLSLTELIAERAVVAALDASCRTPVGVRAKVEGGVLRMSAFVGLPDGSEWVRDSLSAEEEPTSLGRSLAERLLAAGAGELLERSAAMA